MERTPTPFRKVASLLPLLLLPCVGKADTDEPLEHTRAFQVPPSRLEELIALADDFPGNCTPDGLFCAYFSPTDAPILAILKAVRSAQSRIRIVTYNLNVPEFTPLLQEKLAQGVKVDFHLDFKHSETPPRLWHMLPSHPNLTRYALPVLRGRNPQMHNKVIIIDDKVAFIGSANWTFTGTVGNFENVLAIRAPDLVKSFIDELEELRGDAAATCELFAKDISKCGKAPVEWDPSLRQFAMTGNLPSKVLKAEVQNHVQETLRGLYRNLHEKLSQLRMREWAGESTPEDTKRALRKYRDERIQALERRDPAFACRNLLGKGQCEPQQLGAGNLPSDLVESICRNDGLLNQRNAPRVRTLGACILDDRYLTLARHFTRNERLGDGRWIHTLPSDDQWRFFPQQKDSQVFFGPEDMPDKAILNVLDEALRAPAESFVYTSVNFITHRAIMDKLSEIKRRGVRVRILIDRGRWDDPNFSARNTDLQRLGITTGNAEDTSSTVSIFNHTSIGSYGANHNKMAVIGTPRRLTLITGSANWSSMGMMSNDEHVFISRNPFLATIYLREILSQLYIYRYQQREDRPGFQNELSFLMPRVPCLAAMLGKAPSCSINGTTWTPNRHSNAIVSVENVPASYSSRSVWAWVTRGGTSKAYPLFTDESFSNRWLTVVPMRPNERVKFKLFSALPGHRPNGADRLRDFSWETLQNDRELWASTLAVDVIRGRYAWSQP